MCGVMTIGVGVVLCGFINVAIFQNATWTASSFQYCGTLFLVGCLMTCTISERACSKASLSPNMGIGTVVGIIMSVSTSTSHPVLGTQHQSSGNAVSWVLHTILDNHDTPRNYVDP
eukprot:398938-Ditylum_brightwellii.AAC.1